MKYFIKITHETQGKNALQNEIKQLIRDKYHRRIVEGTLEDIERKCRMVQNDIVQLNRKHYRCKPEEWKDRVNSVDVFGHLDFITLTFFKAKEDE
jgi:hypothetical protein